MDGCENFDHNRRVVKLIRDEKTQFSGKGKISGRGENAVAADGGA
jgi:hypothetical protein